MRQSRGRRAARVQQRAAQRAQARGSCCSTEVSTSWSARPAAARGPAGLRRRRGVGQGGAARALGLLAEERRLDPPAHAAHCSPLSQLMYFSCGGKAHQAGRGAGSGSVQGGLSHCGCALGGDYGWVWRCSGCAGHARCGGCIPARHQFLTGLRQGLRACSCPRSCGPCPSPHTHRPPFSPARRACDAPTAPGPLFPPLPGRPPPPGSPHLPNAAADVPRVRRDHDAADADLAAGRAGGVEGDAQPARRRGRRVHLLQEHHDLVVGHVAAERGRVAGAAVGAAAIGGDASVEGWVGGRAVCCKRVCCVGGRRLVCEAPAATGIDTACASHGPAMPRPGPRHANRGGAQAHVTVVLPMPLLARVYVSTTPAPPGPAPAAVSTSSTSGAPTVAVS